ncbi:hypothetical protein AGMMS49942_03590 [Spirochaetia bacterium]|nr:hypothetical protein AGMMS49942_03590 [Spirochaetia bacterium]
MNQEMDEGNKGALEMLKEFINSADQNALEGEPSMTLRGRLILGKAYSELSNEIGLESAREGPYKLAAAALNSLETYRDDLILINDSLTGIKKTDHIPVSVEKIRAVKTGYLTALGNLREMFGISRDSA